MNRLALMLILTIVLIPNQSIFAQQEHSTHAFFAGISSNAPAFGVRNEAYNLRFDSQYFWLSTSIGIESFLKKSKKSTLNTQITYQALPHASMAITQSESTNNGIYTRQFDSLIMKSDNVRFSFGVKKYFSEAFDRFYIQFNAGVNVVFNKTSICSCTRIESEEDNYFSETGDFYTKSQKNLIPELSMSFGYLFKLNDRFSIDAGLDLGVPFGKMKYRFIKDKFPLPSSRTTVMNLNGLFLTSLIEVHAKILFIK